MQVWKSFARYAERYQQTCNRMTDLGAAISALNTKEPIPTLEIGASANGSLSISVLFKKYRLQLIPIYNGNPISARIELVELDCDGKPGAPRAVAHLDKHGNYYRTEHYSGGLTLSDPEDREKIIEMILLPCFPDSVEQPLVTQS